MPGENAFNCCCDGECICTACLEGETVPEEYKVTFSGITKVCDTGDFVNSVQVQNVSDLNQTFCAKCVKVTGDCLYESVGFDIPVELWTAGTGVCDGTLNTIQAEIGLRLTNGGGFWQVQAFVAGNTTDPFINGLIFFSGNNLTIDCSSTFMFNNGITCPPVGNVLGCGGSVTIVPDACP